MNTTKKIIGFVAVTLILAMLMTGAVSATKTYYIADDGSGEGTGSQENPLNAEQFFASVFEGKITVGSTTGIVVPAEKTVTLPSVKKLAYDTDITGDVSVSAHFASYNKALINAGWTNNGTVCVAKEDASYSFMSGWNEPEYQFILAAGSIGGDLELYSKIDFSSMTSESSDSFSISKDVAVTGKGNPSVTLSGKSGYEQINIGNSNKWGFTVSVNNVKILTTSVGNGFNIRGKNIALTLSNVDVAPASGTTPFYADELIEVDDGATGATVTITDCSSIEVGMNAVELRAQGNVILNNSNIKLNTAESSTLKEAIVVQAANTNALNGCKVSIGENCGFDTGETAKLLALYASFKDGAAIGTDTNEVIVTTADGFDKAFGKPNSKLYYAGGVWTGNIVVANDITLSDDYDGMETKNCNRTIVIDKNCTLDLNGHVLYDKIITVNGDVVTRNGATSAGGKLLAKTLTVDKDSTVEEYLDSTSGKSAVTVFDLIYTSIKGGTCTGSIVIMNDVEEDSHIVIPAGFSLSFSGKDISVELPANGTFYLQVMNDALKAGYTFTADGPATSKIVLVQNTKKKTDGPDYEIDGILYLNVPLEFAKASSTAYAHVGNGGKVVVSDKGKITLNGGYLKIGGNDRYTDNESEQITGGFLVFNGETVLDGNVKISNGSLSVMGGTLKLNPNYEYTLGSDSQQEDGAAALNVVDVNGNGTKILGNATIKVVSNASMFFDYNCIDETVFLDQADGVSISRGTGKEVKEEAVTNTVSAEDGQHRKSETTGTSKDKTTLVPPDTPKTQETGKTDTTVVTQEKTGTSKTATESITSTTTTNTPFPILGILAALGAAVILLKRKK